MQTTYADTVPQRGHPVAWLVFAMALYLGPTPDSRSAQTSPETVVSSVSNRILNAMRTRHDELIADPGKLYTLIDNVVVPHFDIDAVTRMVLGPHWRRANASQRQRFTHAFKRLLINSYAKVLLLHRHALIQVQPVPASQPAPRRVAVHSSVNDDGEKSIAIVYRMRLKDGVWKIYDFDVEGVSLILNYKNSFSAQIEKQGLDGLIKSLDEKNAAFTL